VAGSSERAAEEVWVVELVEHAAGFLQSPVAVVRVDELVAFLAGAVFLLEYVDELVGHVVSRLEPVSQLDAIDFAPRVAET